MEMKRKYVNWEKSKINCDGLFFSFANIIFPVIIISMLTKIKMRVYASCIFRTTLKYIMSVTKAIYNYKWILIQNLCFRCVAIILYSRIVDGESFSIDILFSRAFVLLLWLIIIRLLIYCCFDTLHPFKSIRLL